MKVFEVRTTIRVFPALLLLCSLLAHSLDVCAAHVGIPNAQPQTHLSLGCHNLPSPDELCVICPQPTEHAPDLCEVISESSTAAARGFQVEAPPALAPYFLAPPTDLYVFVPSSGTIRSRDGPDVPSLDSLSYRSTLPARAPPSSV